MVQMRGLALDSDNSTCNAAEKSLAESLCCIRWGGGATGAP
jgi:hypothetical protein